MNEVEVLNSIYLAFFAGGMLGFLAGFALFSVRAVKDPTKKRADVKRSDFAWEEKALHAGIQLSGVDRNIALNVDVDGWLVLKETVPADGHVEKVWVATVAGGVDLLDFTGRWLDWRRRKLEQQQKAVL